MAKVTATVMTKAMANVKATRLRSRLRLRLWPTLHLRPWLFMAKVTATVTAKVMANVKAAFIIRANVRATALSTATVTVVDIQKS